MARDTIVATRITVVPTPRTNGGMDSSMVMQRFIKLFMSLFVHLQPPGVNCGARVVPAAELVDEALKTAAAIAAMPPLAAIAAKEAINASFEMPLAQGINFERRLFHGLFGSADQSEGMAAFIEKRPGNWTGK